VADCPYERRTTTQGDTVKRTEAAEIIAIDVRVWARRTGQPITLTLCEERVSELRGDHYQQYLKGEAAKYSNPKTVLREAMRHPL
jgi:hypothetical protein